MIEVPILKEHIPNVYVSVILLKGRTGSGEYDKDTERDTGQPEFKIGYIKLPVNIDPVTLDVKVESNKTQYELLRLFSGEILNLGKNYIALSVMYQYSPLLTFSLTNNLNINDKSGYINLTGNYSLAQDIYMNFGTQVFYGKEQTEYWYFPNSLFLQGEFYF